MGASEAPGGAPASSGRSEDSTERLIGKPPFPGSTRGGLLLTTGGAAQACAGALLLWCGGAALARAGGAGTGPVRWAGGAALWAGGAAVAAGALAALAGLEGLHARNSRQHLRHGSGGLERAALALSLVGAAVAHAAGALAAVALQRLYAHPSTTMHTFQEEMEAWSPVVASGAVLAAACAQCALSGLCAYAAARRVCPCLRPAPAHHLPVHIETKLTAEDSKGSHKRPSKPPPLPPPPPLVLLPATSATMGRVRGMPVGVVVAPRYATLPLAHPHAPPPPAQPRPHLHSLPHPPFYYPQHGHDTRRRRRRGGVAVPAHLTRSLERVHRRRRRRANAENPPENRLSDADLRQTYTGLDRAYAEQFITVCDESRSQATDRSHSSYVEDGGGDSVTSPSMATPDDP